MTNNKCTYYVKGMHCSACELLIEKKIAGKTGVKKVKASLKENKVDIYFTTTEPAIIDLNKDFKNDGYSFSTEQINTQTGKVNTLILLGLIGVAFVVLEKSGVLAGFNINSSTSLLGFFVFGIAASVSTCAALVGGIIISMSKKWNEQYAGESESVRAKPFVLFNLGRVLAFALLGGVLGAIGGVISISTSVSAVFVIAISVVMILLGFQLVGINYFAHVKLPKVLSEKFVDEKRYSGDYMPFLMGAGTFFVPCGFTLVAQTVSLTSGSFIKGSLFMLFFVLGTLPMLSLISFTSVKMNSLPAITKKFNFAAGILVVIFALYNINSQLNVLGVPSLSDLNLTSSYVSTNDKDKVAADSNTIQLVQIEAKGYTYYPRNISVKVNKPVRLEIINTGATGCANAVVGRGLFNGVVYLKDGINVVEFTPQTRGIYKITCSMGMVPPVSVKVI